MSDRTPHYQNAIDHLRGEIEQYHRDIDEARARMKSAQESVLAQTDAENDHIATTQRKLERAEAAFAVLQKHLEASA